LTKGSPPEFDLCPKRVQGSNPAILVRATVVDAFQAGFQVIVIEELCRGVAPDTSQAAWKEMKEIGARILQRFDINRIKAL
jgi:nicotinamidase/pyrazinamidase